VRRRDNGQLTGVTIFGAIEPTAAERSAPMPGDGVVTRADVVMDRAFDVPAPAETVWPWLVQLGKARAGWYFPAAVERWIPRGRRGLRAVDQRWQGLAVGDVIPDWGGAAARFHVVELEPPRTIVYRDRRGRAEVSWAMVLTPSGPGATRLHLRLRLGNLRRRWLAASAGELIDMLTIAGLAAGLRERVSG
jgi:uncharacterized protein YndB with AHSA1/START domain